MGAIDSLITTLHEGGVWICKECLAEGFLSVDVSYDSSSDTITLTQAGLTQCIVEALGLCCRSSTAISTPAESAPLPKDSEGDPASDDFNYAAVVGMLLYLCGHSHPGIAFAIHQCVLYTFRPTHQHELALIRDCFLDADFAGLNGRETPRTLTVLGAILALSS